MNPKLFFVLLATVVLVFGCSTQKVAKYDTQQSTSVDLTNANYHVIKSNAIGSDSGFNLFGIPLLRPSMVDAMGDLREQAPMEGKATAVTNVMTEESKTSFFLFSFPKVKVSADVVEFDKTNKTE